MVGFGGEDYMCGGKYNSLRECQLVIGKLFYAVKEGKRGFEFPQPEELPSGNQHGATSNKRGQSHGGSWQGSGWVEGSERSDHSSERIKMDR